MHECLRATNVKKNIQYLCGSVTRLSAPVSYAMRVGKYSKKGGEQFIISGKFIGWSNPRHFHCERE